MKYVFILLAGTLLLCCNKREDKCQKYQVAPITSINMPDTVALNSEVELDMEYLLDQDCGRADASVEIDSIGTTVNVTILTLQAGCECKQIAGYIPIKHKLTAGQAGTFQFRFASGPGYYLHTLVVQ